jgi:choline dehydrogenase-like flavoprotein
MRINMSTISKFDEFGEHVRRNQHKLGLELRSHYDFIVCGSGSSGSVVARRLAENPDVSVLLIEAGESDDVPTVAQANQWPLNLGSERDWSFQGEPNPHTNGRSIPYPMGKVLGGDSSINVMVWARGHKRDWDAFASTADDQGLELRVGFEALSSHRGLAWRCGSRLPRRGGPVFVEPAPDPNPLASATVEAARSIGIPTYENPNGRMMESDGGAATTDVRARLKPNKLRILRLRALGAIAVCGVAELPLNLFNQNFPLPHFAVAFDNFSGASISMSLGGVVTDTDSYMRVERANHCGTGSFERITHSRSQIVGAIIDGHQRLLGQPSG